MLGNFIAVTQSSWWLNWSAVVDILCDFCTQCEHYLQIFIKAKIVERKHRKLK